MGKILCNDCSYASNGKKLLFRHWHSQHCPLDRRRIAAAHCDECSHFTISKFELAGHLNSVHQYAKPQFHCDDCSQKARSRQSYFSHWKSAHCRKDLRNMASHHCDDCDHFTSNKSRITNHWTARHSPKPAFLVCDNCAYEARQRGSMTDHLKRVHKFATPLRISPSSMTCDLCNKVMIGSSPTQIVFLHLIHTHRFWPFEITCDVCLHGFASKSELTTHVRLHSKALKKLHKVSYDECLKEFATKGGFVFHWLHTHSGNRDEVKKLRRETRKARAKANPPPSIICDNCGSTYRTRPALLFHLRRC